MVDALWVQAQASYELTHDGELSCSRADLVYYQHGWLVLSALIILSAWWYVHVGYIKFMLNHVGAVTQFLEQFDLILIDEAQDLNACMLQFLNASQVPQVFVGDPAQQLYRWRGGRDAGIVFVFADIILVVQSR